MLKLVLSRKTSPRSWNPLVPWLHAIVTGVVLATFAAVAALAEASIPLPKDEAERMAIDHLRASCATLGLTDEDVADIVVKDIYSSRHNGLTHVYLRQRHEGIEVADADMTLNVTASGQVSHVGHRFVSDLASRVEPALPSVSAADALARVAADLGAPSASRGDVPAALRYRQQPGGNLQLVWELEIDGHEAHSFCGVVLVDATHGEILERWSWTGELAAESVVGSPIDGPEDGRPDEGSSPLMNPDSYQVFAIPKEHPDDGPRTVEINPALDGGLASPFNWHDTDGVAGPEFTITRGNNAHAYTDLDANNVPDAGSSPDGGGGLNFSSPLDLTQAPSTYRPAAVTNAFYWNNLLHDVLWLYGFDESAGSFQTNNYGRGGLGSDAVLVEVQDGSGFNNANITTAADGVAPRMQLYLWNATAPNRDAALANGVVADIYAYGAAGRLVGGPGNPTCLNVSEASSMRWGWADWVGLVLTAVPSDTEATPRGLATYLMGQPPAGAGIRVRPYTTDFAVNELTYGHVPTLVVPHGVGTAWCTMLWELYWELVSIHGFNPDIYDDWTTGGNNLALQLIIDGMKIVPCSPGFVDGRNAILVADQVLTGGANRCAIWRAFALRGLGFSASQGSSSSTTDGVAAFDLPPECQAAAVEDGSSAPQPSFDHALQAHPNPFNPQTNLSFELDAGSATALEIYDLHGRLVRRMEGGLLPRGRHELVWDGRDGAGRSLASGEYIVRLVVNGEAVATRKAILVK